MNLLIKNVRIENAPQLTDIRIKDGKFAQLEAGLEAQGGEQIVDGGGRLVLPPYIESHVHLDSALTSGQPRYNESGTLFEGIEVWSERKKSLTYADAYERALADGLKVVDASAFALCRDNGLTMRVFGMGEGGGITRALLGEQIGTLVTQD